MTVRRLIQAGGESLATPDLALISWAFVHGLVVLARDGALQAAAGADNAAGLVHHLTGVFTEYVGHELLPAPADPGE